MKKILATFLGALLLGSCQVNTGGVTVKAVVTGLNGSGLVLQNNGTDNLAVAADGTYSFNTTLSTGSAYSVTVKSNPMCKNQICTISSGSGTAVSGDPLCPNNICSGTATSTSVTVNVTCSGSKTLLASSNWGNLSLKFTDDIHSISDGGTAVPRTVIGAATLLNGLTSRMNLTIDRIRKTAYVISGTAIRAFSNIDTTTGNVAPARSITLSGVSVLNSISVDSINDRLYISGGSTSSVYILNSASTLTGTVTPNTTLSAQNGFIFLDEKNDRLYTSNAGSTITVYDSASTLSNTSVANRTITLVGGGLNNYASLWVDGCTDKLIVDNRDGSSAGNEIAIFNSASTLSGTVSFDTSSAARINFDVTMNVAVDNYNDVLFAWTDSASSVKLWNNFSTLSGTVGSANKTINGVVANGYGMALYNY